MQKCKKCHRVFFCSLLLYIHKQEMLCKKGNKMDKKIIIAASMLMILTFLFGTIYFPNNALMLFAADGVGYTILRIGLLVMLGIILVTNPPRSDHFRITLGTAAVVLGISAVYLVLNYMLTIVDTVLLLQTAIILGIEALEIDVPKPAKAKIRFGKPQMSSH